VATAITIPSTTSNRFLSLTNADVSQENINSSHKGINNSIIGFGGINSGNINEAITSGTFNRVGGFLASTLATSYVRNGTVGVTGSAGSITTPSSGSFAQSGGTAGTGTAMNGTIAFVAIGTSVLDALAYAEIDRLYNSTIGAGLP